MTERQSTAAELPYEIQCIIFEIAAKLDGRFASRLILVAKWVRDLIYPILYERIVIRDENAAASLLETIHARSPAYFVALTKSLTVGRQIPHKLIKPLFARLSKGTIAFTIFCDSKEADGLLRYIRSPFIRRLTLVYERPARRHYIPLDILSSISHLTLIANSVHGGLNINRAIEIAFAMHINDINWLNAFGNPTPSLPPFHRLTFVATSYERWQTMRILLTAAPELKCFALLLPSNSSMIEISQCIQPIRNTGDPRMVVLTRHGRPTEWSIDDGFAPSDFWITIEDLVRNRHICDDGERWEEDVIKDFRVRHPEISLLGD